MEQKFFYLGVDLGQASDYTALALLEKSFVIDPAPHSYKMVPSYSCTYLDRARETSYPDIVDQIKTLLRNPKLADAKLVCDETGVGRPVCDLMEEAGLHPVRVNITGGSQVREHDDGFAVPKRDLISALMILFQSRALKISSKLEHAATLAEELENFRVKTDIKTGHETYEHWREGQHDDLVLSLSLAAWYAECQDDRTSGLESRRPSPVRKDSYSPLTWKTKREKR
jgi:hypothetical protein